MKKVSFSDLTILEYPIILGDNPSCSDGCPITIDWLPVRCHKCSMDLYEYTKIKTPKNQLMIPVKERTKILLDAGFLPEEIVQRIMDVAEARYEREESIRQYTPPSSSNSSSSLQKIGKFSKNFVSSFAKLGSGIRIKPSNSKKTVIAQSA